MAESDDMEGGTWKLGQVEVNPGGDPFASLVHGLMRAFSENRTYEMVHFMSVHPWVLPMERENISMPCLAEVFSADHFERAFSRIGYEVQTLVLSPGDPLREKKLERANTAIGKFFEVSIPFILGSGNEFHMLLEYVKSNAGGSEPGLLDMPMRSRSIIGESTRTLNQLVTGNQNAYLMNLVARHELDLARSTASALSEGRALCRLGEMEYRMLSPPGNIGRERGKGRVTFSARSLLRLFEYLTRDSGSGPGMIEVQKLKDLLSIWSVGRHSAASFILGLEESGHWGRHEPVLELGKRFRESGNLLETSMDLLWANLLDEVTIQKLSTMVADLTAIEETLPALLEESELILGKIDSIMRSTVVKSIDAVPEGAMVQIPGNPLIGGSADESPTGSTQASAKGPGDSSAEGSGPKPGNGLKAVKGAPVVDTDIGDAAGGGDDSPFKSERLL